MSDDWGDRYVVIIGTWHFGPFGFAEGHAFAYEHGGTAWPLWKPDDTDELTQQPALALATEARVCARPGSPT